MATHGMIDLETLSTEPDAVVMTIGAVKFDPYTNAEPHAPFYLRCDVEEQVNNWVDVLMMILLHGGVDKARKFKTKHLVTNMNV